jgi:DNA-binding transcriptional regulator YdaS (Cro superfamily)
VYYDKKLKREVVPTHKSDNQPLETRKLTPEEVKLVLTDKRDNVALARLLGVVPQSVSQIRTGRSYKDLWPELPRRAAQVKALGAVPTIRSTKITCQDCAHWWQKRCGLDIPEAGGTFAIQCSFYQVDE